MPIFFCAQTRFASMTHFCADDGIGTKPERQQRVFNSRWHDRGEAWLTMIDAVPQNGDSLKWTFLDIAHNHHNGKFFIKRLNYQSALKRIRPCNTIAKTVYQIGLLKP